MGSVQSAHMALLNGSADTPVWEKGILTKRERCSADARVDFCVPCRLSQACKHDQSVFINAGY